MDSVAPRQYLPIINQISDPLDTTTYYVRAYIYKCVGNDAPSLIKTINLADRGGQRFTYQYQTPADVSGEGYFLSIITKTFTDSGYTTESSNYERTEERYKVIERIQHFGGGDSISYKRVREIIKDEISKRKIEKVEKISLSPVLDEIKKLHIKDERVDSVLIKLNNIEKKILGIDIPEQDDSKINEVKEAIKKLKEQIYNIKIPIPDKVNLSPIIDKLNNIELDSGNSFEKILKQFKGFNGFFFSKDLPLKNTEEEKPKSKSKIRL